MVENCFKRIVKLNLAKDQSNVLSSQNNDRLNALKIRNLELKNKINQLKAQCQEEEINTNQLSKNVNDLINSKTTENDLIGKQTDLAMLNTFLNKANSTTSKINNFSQKLFALSNEVNENTISKKWEFQFYA
jgi:hypothetical protein